MQEKASTQFSPWMGNVEHRSGNEGGSGKERAADVAGQEKKYVVDGTICRRLPMGKPCGGPMRSNLASLEAVIVDLYVSHASTPYWTCNNTVRYCTVPVPLGDVLPPYRYPCCSGPHPTRGSSSPECSNRRSRLTSLLRGATTSSRRKQHA